MRLRFADCLLDCDQYELRRAGARVEVQPKVWAFLRLLAESPHRVLTKDEILDRLWPGVAVEEASLQRLASLARQALGEEGRDLLRTVRGVGYQLAAEVRTEGDAPARVVAVPEDSDAEEPGPPQEIRYCHTVDGVNVAWARTGRGAPLVRALGWFTNLESEWAWSAGRRFWEKLGAGRELIRYDGRGMGLSDPAGTFSPETRLRDLEAVVDAAGRERVDLIGLSEGCATALAYAARHPERVRRIVLYGPAPMIFLGMVEPVQELGNVLLALIQGGWGGRSEPLAHALAGLFLGEHADPETRRHFDRMMRASADRETAARYLLSLASVDGRDDAKKIQAPVLVVHRRDDVISPIAAGRAAAALVPGAGLVTLPGDTHWCLACDPGAEALVRAVREFLDKD
jgi:pimeloyl-ACP methyl ester carboxylesterase/DNA-binding winged helix-turn-helix (wHTH) protein